MTILKGALIQSLNPLGSIKNEVIFNLTQELSMKFIRREE